MKTTSSSQNNKPIIKKKKITNETSSTSPVNERTKLEPTSSLNKLIKSYSSGGGQLDDDNDNTEQHQQTSVLLPKSPWIEKYRPTDLDSMIGQHDKIELLNSLIEHEELPHLLFYGSVGTGKTSMILNIAKKIYGDEYKMYMLELNASDDRGIDIVRNKIPNFVKVKSNKIRLVILDEADAMTQDAQSALRRVMEIYSKNCRFCIICNNINKIIPGIQSRCAKMRFGNIDASKIQERLYHIIQQEHIHIDENAVTYISNLNKDLRTILNTLQCLHTISVVQHGANYPNITITQINEFIGRPTVEEVKEILYKLNNMQFLEGFKYLSSIINRKRYYLLDVLEVMSHIIIQDEELFEFNKKMEMIEKLSQIENRIINGRDGEIQLSMIASVICN